jgi:hypothetical protein
MQAIAQIGPPHEPASRPGLTSLIRTGRGLMTVQTEIAGDPGTLVTIIDFRGRVLKTWHSPFVIIPADPAAPEKIRRWHAEIESSVRNNLTRVSERQRITPNHEPVSHLFVAAARAYAERDLDTAGALLRACELLLPDDPRIREALRHLPRTR